MKNKITLHKTIINPKNEVKSNKYKLYITFYDDCVLSSPRPDLGALPLPLPLEVLWTLEA
jgi:hypothetical protein